MEFSTEEQLKQLERRLKSAIKAEEYEEAAVCRDRIKALKEENEKLAFQTPLLSFYAYGASRP